jgi:hypothetical protein
MERLGTFDPKIHLFRGKEKVILVFSGGFDVNL